MKNRMKSKINLAVMLLCCTNAFSFPLFNYSELTNELNRQDNPVEEEAIFNFNNILGKLYQIGTNEYQRIKQLQICRIDACENFEFINLCKNYGGTHSSRIIILIVHEKSKILFRYAYSDQAIQGLSMTDNRLLVLTRAKYMSFQTPAFVYSLELKNGELKNRTLGVAPQFMTNIFRRYSQGISIPFILEWDNGLLLDSAIRLTNNILSCDFGFAAFVFKYNNQILYYDNDVSNENNAELNEKGEEYFAEGSYTNSLICFKRLFQSDPMNFRYLSNLSVTYYKLGDLNKAVRASAFSYFIAKNDNEKAIALFNNGLANLKFNRYECTKLAYYSFKKSYSLRKNELVRKEMEETRAYLNDTFQENLK